MAKKEIKTSFTFVDCVFSILAFPVYNYIFEWNL